MPAVFHCESIVFDLDGTLWSPLDATVQAWRRACKRHNMDFSSIDIENIKASYGLTSEDAAAIILPYISSDKRKAMLEDANQYENMLILQGFGTLFDGVSEVLALLAQTKRLFICSNCQSGYIEAFFHTHRLSDIFTATIASGDTGKDKATNLRILVDKHQIKQAVFVGDTESDSYAAKKNNIPFIFAAYGFGKTVHFDASIANFKTLIDLIK